MKVQPVNTNSTKLTFKRFEKKYILSPEQYESFMVAAKDHLVPGEFHKSLVMSIYYDDENYSLIRHSLDAPVYKDKLRIRSYGIPEEDGSVFVELKKKYDGIVYKRRVEMKVREAEAWIAGTAKAPFDSQVVREIDWFLQRGRLEPKVFIGCDRTSWADKDNPELRFTFDSSIRWRDTDLSLTLGDHGNEQLPEDSRLLEIKVPDAAPLWLAGILSNEKIFPHSYSKYGTYYTSLVKSKGDK